MFYHLLTKNSKKNENQKVFVSTIWLVAVILEIKCFVLMTEIGHFQGNSRKNKSRNKSRKCVEIWNLRHYHCLEKRFWGQAKFKIFVGIYSRAKALFKKLLITDFVKTGDTLFPFTYNLD